MMEDVNRIKLVLVEKKRTNKWLSEQMGVTPSIVSMQDAIRLYNRIIIK